MGNVYKVRYKAEAWNKEVEEVSEVVRDGVRVTESDYGYADRLFIVSIVEGAEGDSCLLMDSEEGLNVSRETILMIREQLDHYLEHHCGEKA